MLKLLVFSALGVLVSILLFIWLITRVRYRVGRHHIKVLLFGIPLRRVAIATIESVSKRTGDGLAEYWLSTMRPKHRMLVLRRSKGLCRNFVITPRNRYVFKTDVERAVRRVTGRQTQSDELSDKPEPAPSTDSSES